VAALQPFSTKVFSWFLVTIVALIAAFLVRGEYARKETVVGYLTPMSGTSKVFSNSRRPVKASVYRGFPLVLS
jgi:membrane fusion protein